MATFDILDEDYNGSDELLIKIDNPDKTLSYTGNGPSDIKYSYPPSETNKDPDLNPVQVFVVEGQSNSANPNPLVFRTSMRKIGAPIGKLANRYCMAIEEGVPVKKKGPRRTNATVSSGGGISTSE